MMPLVVTDQAVCRTPDVEPDTWFSNSILDQMHAQTYCLECPVQQACRTEGDTVMASLDAAGLELDGIWGGLTRDMRKADREGIPGPRVAVETNPERIKSVIRAASSTGLGYGLARGLKDELEQLVRDRLNS